MSLSDPLFLICIFEQARIVDAGSWRGFSMQERRKLTRTHIFKDALIIRGPSSTIKCVVRDLTSNGARVEASHIAELPDVVDVTFDSGRTLRRCRLVWRSFKRLGVKFL
jgi:hypothetical protein